METLDSPNDYLFVLEWIMLRQGIRIMNFSMSSDFKYLLLNGHCLSLSILTQYTDNKTASYFSPQFLPTFSKIKVNVLPHIDTSQD